MRFIMKKSCHKRAVLGYSQKPVILPRKRAVLGFNQKPVTLPLQRAFSLMFLGYGREGTIDYRAKPTNQLRPLTGYSYS